MPPPLSEPLLEIDQETVFTVPVCSYQTTISSSAACPFVANIAIITTTAEAAPTVSSLAR